MGAVAEMASTHKDAKYNQCTHYEWSTISNPLLSALKDDDESEAYARVMHVEISNY